MWIVSLLLEMQLVSTILGMGPVLAKIFGETFQNQEALVETEEQNTKMCQGNDMMHGYGSSFEMF